jgi:hypothetical protein
MAQDPLKPRDNGRIRLPPVDGGMNKISPAFKMDDKGTALGAPKGNKATHEKLLERIRKRMERAIAAESENRKAALDDRKFKKGDQWPSEVVAQRNLDKRPCLTINKLPTFVHQITNDQRQNRPSINISPVGDRGDPEVAKMYRGLIRHIERDSAADIAYDTAFDDAVSMGWGYWRVLTEWEAPDSFNLVLVIRRIRNPFTVYLDPAAQDPTGADAKWGFITDLIPREEFDEKYPDADPMPYTAGGIGETLKNWINKDEVRIAEYFEIEYKTRTLVELSNGHSGWEDELAEITQAAIARGKLTIVDEREARCPKVMWYKVTAKDVLMEREWPGTTVPIVKVIGEENDIEGKVLLSGVVRNAKDSQRMYNYWRTAETELVALAPKAPWVVEEGQIEGHEDEFKMANIRSMPYLSYKGTSIAGTPAPPPQRQQFAGVPAGVVQAAQGAAQDMMATTGIRFDATMNERMIDESGKAIRELRRSGDVGNFHFVDNLARSLRRTGEILVELIPLIYADARTITILREDDKEEQVGIDPSLPNAAGEMRRPQDGKRIKLFNPKVGKYGVTVTVGPSYATKRIEASENMMNFARAMPQTAALIADLIAKNQDWPGAEEIAARLAKTLPPNLLQPDMKDVTPQIQAIISSQEAQIKDLSQKLQQAIAAVTDKKADREVLMEQIKHDFEARLLKIAADTETKIAALQQKADAHHQTQIGDHLQQLGEEVGNLIQTMDAGSQQPAAPGQPANDQGAAAQPGAGGGQPAEAQKGAAAPDEAPPPEALRHLKPGRVTTFGNGQKWTLQNGQPVRAA